jgi:hypothetical protein
MKITAGGVAGGFLAFMFLIPQSALAMSAFAAGVPDDVARAGVALGEGHNYPSRDEAENRALAECRGNKDTTEAVHALCRIIDHFDNRCLTTSLDPKAGTPGWGWAVADTQNDANDQALAMCRQSAGSDRAAYCEVSQSICDRTVSSSK